MAKFEVDLDDDELEELAKLWGVDADDVLTLLEQTGYSDDVAFATHTPEPPEPERAWDLDEYESDDEDVEEIAELYGVSEAEAEALRDVLDDFQYQDMTHGELRAYIDDLYDALTDEGWDLDVSDLWDMYYGYTPAA